VEISGSNPAGRVAHDFARLAGPSLELNLFFLFLKRDFVFSIKKKFTGGSLKEPPVGPFLLASSVRDARKRQ